MASDNKNELDRSLDEIRREVIEARNLVIKTDNQVKNLQADVKLVGKRQEEGQRKQWMSSAVAYAMFVGLCIAGTVLITSARTAAASQEKARLEKQVADLNAVTDKIKTDAALAAGQEKAAMDVYRMMSAGTGVDRLKGVDALAKVDTAKLTPFLKQVLNDRAASLKKELGATALERGRSAFKRQDFPTAVEELNRFMALTPTEEEAVEASWYLGDSLVQLRKYEPAIPYLVRFIQGDRRAKVRDFAMAILIQSYDMTGQRDKAIETAREAANTYPNSDFGPQFRARLSRKNDPNAAPAAPGAAGSSPGPAAAPARPGGAP
jgi:TolA-binding protein